MTNARTPRRGDRDPFVSRPSDVDRVIQDVADAIIVDVIDRLHRGETHPDIVQSAIRTAETKADLFRAIERLAQSGLQWSKPAELHQKLDAALRARIRKGEIAFEVTADGVAMMVDHVTVTDDEDLPN
jgi:hypothetical protein